MQGILAFLLLALPFSGSCKFRKPSGSGTKDAAITQQGGDSFLFFGEGENVVIRKCPTFTSFFEKDGTPKSSAELKSTCSIAHSSVPVAQFKANLSQALKLTSRILSPADRDLVERYKVSKADTQLDVLRQQKADITVELQPITDFLNSLTAIGVPDVESNLSAEQQAKKKELEGKIKDLEAKIAAGEDMANAVKEVNSRIESLVNDLILKPGITKESFFVFSRDGQGFIYNILNSYVQNANLLNLGFAFVAIPSGKFSMGSPAAEVGRNDDEAAHTVNLLNSFEIMTTEVKQKSWFDVMGYNPSRFRTKESCPATYYEVNGTGVCPDHPVESITWNQTQEFVRRVNDALGEQFRLPTEAEWEYAARGGRTSPYVGGDNANDLHLYAWLESNADAKTHPVASKNPHTTYGEKNIYDALGNVWEWTSDWYAAYPTVEVTAPKGPDQGQEKVIRGCAWSANAKNCRFANREKEVPANSSTVIGFRLVREVKL